MGRFVGRDVYAETAHCHVTELRLWVLMLVCVYMATVCLIGRLTGLYRRVARRVSTVIKHISIEKQSNKQRDRKRVKTYTESIVDPMVELAAWPTLV